MHVTEHLPLDELRGQAEQESDKRRFVRNRSVILAAEGLTATQIAEALGYSRRAVQGWVARDNAEGPEGLGDRPRPGQPAHLPEAQVERLRLRIDAGPTPGDAVSTIRAAELRSILAAEFGVAYSLSGVYALLHQLGYSCLVPRPRHRKSDPLAQEEFKRKSPG